MWLEGTINGEAIISTPDAIYEGEVFGITDEFLTMEFFNGVKDETARPAIGRRRNLLARQRANFEGAVRRHR